MRTSVFCILTLGFLIVPLSLAGQPAEPERESGETAKSIVNKQGWLYQPSEKTPGRTHYTQLWCSLIHPTNTTFSSSDGSFVNVGSYDEAFDFYARKCGKEEGYKLKTGAQDLGTSAAGDFAIEAYGTKDRRHARFTLHTSKAVVRVILEEIKNTRNENAFRASVFLSVLEMAGRKDEIDDSN